MSATLLAATNINRMENDMTFDPLTLAERPTAVLDKDGRGYRITWDHPELAYVDEVHDERVVPQTVLSVQHNATSKQYEAYLTIQERAGNIITMRIEPGAMITMYRQSAKRFSRKALDEVLALAESRLPQWIEADERVASLWAGRNFAR
jgi:hypothetical protein